MTACAYEEFHETIMADTDWDMLGKELYDRRGEWSPYFRACLPASDFNPGTTASGINWQRGIPKLVWASFKSLDGDYTVLYQKWTTIFSGALPQ